MVRGVREGAADGRGRIIGKGRRYGLASRESPASGSSSKLGSSALTAWPNSGHASLRHSHSCSGPPSASLAGWPQDGQSGGDIAMTMVYPLSRGRRRPCSRRGLAMSLATQRRRAMIGGNEAPKRLRITAEPRFIHFRPASTSCRRRGSAIGSHSVDHRRVPEGRRYGSPGRGLQGRSDERRGAARQPSRASVCPLDRGLVVQRVHASADAVCDELREGAVRDGGAIGSADRLVSPESGETLQRRAPHSSSGWNRHADPLTIGVTASERCICAATFPSSTFDATAVFLRPVVLRFRRPPEPVACR